MSEEAEERQEKIQDEFTDKFYDIVLAACANRMTASTAAMKCFEVAEQYKNQFPSPQEVGEWISVEDRLPELNKTVIGYFPEGTEGSRGACVSTAVCWNGKKLVSDFPNSTASWFEASHWQEFPKWMRQE